MIEVKIDINKAEKTADLVSRMFVGSKAEDSLSNIQGIVIGLLVYMKSIQQRVVHADKGAMERFVLECLTTTEPGTGLNFSQYIKFDNEEQA